MAIGYSWTIHALEKQNHNNMQDVICRVQWTKTGTDDADNISYSMAGSTEFNVEEVDPNNFATFSSLTEQNVIDWVAAKEDSNSYYNQIIEEGIRKSRNITKVESGNLPWNPPTE